MRVAQAAAAFRIDAAIYYRSTFLSCNFNSYATSLVQFSKGSPYSIWTEGPNWGISSSRSRICPSPRTIFASRPYILFIFIPPPPTLGTGSPRVYFRVYAHVQRDHVISTAMGEKEAGEDVYEIEDVVDAKISKAQNPLFPFFACVSDG